VGQRISVQEDLVPARIIVGVLRDTHLNSRDPGSSAHVYLPFADSPAGRFTLVTCCTDLQALVHSTTPGSPRSAAIGRLASYAVRTIGIRCATDANGGKSVYGSVWYQ
jgi:hypothetical protein